MAFFDLPLDQLRTYQPPRTEPTDFDVFWARTLAEARQFPLNPQFVPVSDQYGLKSIEAFDLTFNGYGGQPVKGWLLLPRQRTADRLPCVIEFIGYGGGRGYPFDWLHWPNLGYAHMIMDTRGQGSMWRRGDTPDPEVDGGNPQIPGFMTRGILKPETYYYRRVFTDAVRIIEVAAAHPTIDPAHLAATGGSQGGGITIAAGALSGQLQAIMPDVPFLCDYRRATEMVNTHPYQEIVLYCKTHREHIDQVFSTLAYFDGVNMAARCRMAGLFSTALMDDICPPSTVFAAYNHFGGVKDIKVWPYNGHEGGGDEQLIAKARFLSEQDGFRIGG